MTRRKKWLVIACSLILGTVSAGAIGAYWIYHEIRLAATESMEAFKLDPKDMGSEQFKAQLDMATRCADSDLKKSLKGCSALIDQGNKSAKIYRLRGDDFIKLKRYGEAIQDYTTAFQLDPKSTPPDVIRGEIEDTKSDSAGTRSSDDKAISFYSSAIEHVPASWEAYQHRGTDYLLHSQYDLALADFNRAIETYSDDTPAFMKALGQDVLGKDRSLYLLRGLTYQKKGDYDLALDDFNHGLKVGNGCCTVLIYKNLQNVHFLKGDFSAAVDNSKKAVKLDPTDVNNIIWLHLERMRAGQNDKREFEKNTSNLHPDEWYRLVLAYLSGAMTADELLQKSAAIDVDPAAQKQKLCADNFYIGESLLAKHDDKSADYLRATDQTCPKENGYRIAADAELARTTATDK